MDKLLLSDIEKLTKDKIVEIKPVSGGDINRSIRIKTTSGNYFLKYNDLPHSNVMFYAEAEALRVIRDQGILCPDVLGIVKGLEISGLLMHFIDKSHPKTDSYTLAGRNLAKLHKYTTDYYGWYIDNYIGPIKQINKTSKDWPAFYWENRIEPLLKQAYDNQLISHTDYKAANHLEVTLSYSLVWDTASFLHGDLWSGNILFNSLGTPIFIDPASYFGNREKDLAMTSLFGRFPSSFYDAYNEIYPVLPDIKERIPFYHLYYLLIHLILFGSSYYGSVKSILAKANSNS
jgi:protein-ribulosamine 3-kinase